MKSIEQAKRIYELCISAKSPLTYGEVIDKLGYERGVSGNAIRYGLELVLIACADRGLPKLASIIVNQSTGAATPKQLPVDSAVFDQKEWPRVDEIDWGYVWKNRRLLSHNHGTPGYWDNK